MERNTAMTTERNILKWTLEYACKYKYHSIISAITKQTSNIDELGVPKLYLVTSALHSIVSAGEIDKYPQAVQYLQFLFENCKSFIPFKTFSRLITGVKMMVLMKMLEDKEDGVILKLNEYFPRSGADYPDVEQRQLKRLSSVYSNFRKFYLPLSANNKLCEDYFKEEFQEEYGKEFHDALIKLMKTFLSKIEGYFPMTVLEKFMTLSEEECYKLHENMSSASFEMFLDIFIGKSELSESDLTEMLTLMGTITERERVQPLVHNWSCTSPQRSSGEVINSGSKSLFSSSSEFNKLSSDNNVKSLRSSVDKVQQRKSFSSHSEEIFDSHETYRKRLRGNTCHSQEIFNSHETYRKRLRGNTCCKNTFENVNKCNSILVRNEMHFKTCELSPECLSSSNDVKKGSESSNLHCVQNLCETCDNGGVVEKPQRSSSNPGVSRMNKGKLDSQTMHRRTSTRLRTKQANEKENLTGSKGIGQKKKRSKLLDSLPKMLDKDAFVAEYIGSLDQNINIYTNDTIVSEKLLRPYSGQCSCFYDDDVYTCSWPSKNQRQCSHSSELISTSNGVQEWQTELHKIVPQVQNGSSEEIEILTLESSLPSKSYSDIDINATSNHSHDDEDLVPTSDLDEFDLDEVYNLDLERLPQTKTTKLTIPELSHHARHPDVKLCIIKLFRNRSMDIEERGQIHTMYS